MSGKVRITLVRSGIGSPERLRLTLKGLGLTKLNKSVEREDSRAIRGMITKVQHLVRVEPAQ